MGMVNIPQHRNIAEWAEDETHRIRIRGFESQLQQMTVTSNTTREPIQIPVMRIYIKEFDGETVDKEWNIASKRLMVTMNELLKRPDINDLLLEVTKTGRPPKTTWSVNVLGGQK
jgi:hypothetical protein